MRLKNIIGMPLCYKHTAAATWLKRVPLGGYICSNAITFRYMSSVGAICL
jgi:hypothetical protein